LVVLALLLARVANWALFRAFLPIFLGVLSIFFGRGLRRAAWRCRDIGVEGDRGLLHAMDAVRERILGRTPIDVEGEPVEPEDGARESASPPEQTPRTRVSGGRVRVEHDASATEHEAELEDSGDDTDRGRREQR
jgi:hypothetical protein